MRLHPPFSAKAKGSCEPHFYWKGQTEITRLYAQPYDTSACGFFFEDAETYARKAAALRNDYGQPVEEFEIQFIDGENIDAELAKAWGLSQCNLARFLEVVEKWSDDQKIHFIIGVGECCFGFDPDDVDPYQFDVDIYHVDSLRDLAEQFVDDGLFGEFPKHLEFYIDYDAIARDLAVDFSIAEINGGRLAYACR